MLQLSGRLIRGAALQRALGTQDSMHGVAPALAILRTRNSGTSQVFPILLIVRPRRGLLQVHGFVLKSSAKQQKRPTGIVPASQSQVDSWGTRPGRATTPSDLFGCLSAGLAVCRTCSLQSVDGETADLILMGKQLPGEMGGFVWILYSRAEGAYKRPVRGRWGVKPGIPRLSPRGDGRGWAWISTPSASIPCNLFPIKAPKCLRSPYDASLHLSGFR